MHLLLCARLLYNKLLYNPLISRGLGLLGACWERQVPDVRMQVLTAVGRIELHCSVLLQLLFAPS